MKYRKKHVVDAFRLGEAWPGWWSAAVDANIATTYNDPYRAEIKTPEGTMWAHRGDWIVRGVKGEIYPCKDEIFEATYEPA